MNTIRTRLAVAAIAGQVLFVGAVIVLGAVEGDGYAPGRHDVSDLAALTANHATGFRLALALSGASTIAFGLALRSVLGRSAWLLALSLPALDNFTDTFFRLDCRAVDPGCSAITATDSWHGTLHVVFFVVAAVPTLAGPFLLARAMRRQGRWADLTRPTTWYGVAIVGSLVLTGATTGTDVQGWTQRAAIVVTTAGIALLAGQVIRREDRAPRTARVTAAPPAGRWA